MSISTLNRATTTFTVTAIFAAALVGCGGGGGSSNTSTPPAPIVTAPVAANLVTTVTAASYAGEFASAYNLLNAERGRCGLGLLAQNASLDAAAMSHANYSYTTGDTAHTETAGQPGFTGVTVFDRAKAKGYPGSQSSVSEVASVGSAAIAIRGLLTAPYHLNALTRGYRDIGVGYQTSASPVLNFVVDLGFNSSVGEQLFSAADVATYPCEGTTGVNKQLRGETPNPIPGRDLVTTPIGTPIAVRVRPGNVLAITNSGMVNLANGIQVPMRAPIVASNDPNKVNGVSYFLPNEGYVAPDVPLDANTKYQVTIVGTNNSAPFSRTFTFTTGIGG